MDRRVDLVGLTAAEVNDKLLALRANNYAKLKDLSQEQIKYEITNILKQSEVSASELKLLGLAISFSEGSQNLESGIDAYSSSLAQKLYRNKEKIYGKENEKPKAVYYFRFNPEKVKSLRDSELETYARQVLLESGMPEESMSMPVSNFKDLNFGDNFSLGGSASVLETTTELVKVFRSRLLTLEQQKIKAQGNNRSAGVLDAHLQRMLDEEDRVNGSELKKDEFVKDKKPSVDKEKEEEKSQDNEQQSSNPVFANKPNISDKAIKEKFDEFCKKAEELVDMLVMSHAPKENFRSFLENFVSDFKTLENLCQQRSTSMDAQKALNFSKGVVHYVLCTYQNLDNIQEHGLSVHTVNKIYTSKHGPIDSNDMDGISRVSRNHGHDHEHEEPAPQVELDDGSFVEVDEILDAPEENITEMFNDIAKCINQTHKNLEELFTQDEIDFMNYMGFDNNITPEELRDYLNTETGRKDMAFYHQMTGEMEGPSKHDN